MCNNNSKSFTERVRARNREQLRECMNVSAQFIVSAPFLCAYPKILKMYYFKLHRLRKFYSVISVKNYSTNRACAQLSKEKKRYVIVCGTLCSVAFSMCISFLRLIVFCLYPLSVELLKYQIFTVSMSTWETSV